ncbi:SGNH hydrolase-type esterase domain-containing protein [Cadophora sp. MPI-SDFR-AT-0126]|nr:SGNH hydrolase-type esterase domain-containing protein [Leotiomycetes sp. MPI-SDFR-AT-0126]
MIPPLHLQQQPLLSHPPNSISPLDNTPSLNLPHLGSFYALGDSYSAGIGANCSWVTDEFDPTGACLKCKGAYPYQLISIANSTTLPPPKKTPESEAESTTTVETAAQVYHLGCTGASIPDILTVGYDNRTSQLDLMSDAISSGGPLGTWATLSIGGNDVGFGDVVADCVMLDTAGCDASLNATERMVRDPGLLGRLVEVYLSILDAAPVKQFTLIVTSYARFFNAETEECDKHFFIRGRYLTRPFRRRLNAMIEDLNLLIQAAVAIVQMELIVSGSGKSVFYEDWDAGFEGRRFCDVGSGDGEKRHWERDAWFFTVAGDDILEGGESGDGGRLGFDDVGVPFGEEKVDFEKLARECEREREREREWDWSERFLCNWAKALHDEKRDGLKGEGKEGDNGFQELSKTVYPWYVKKVMHPKTIAHAELGRRIYQRWMNGEYS